MKRNRCLIWLQATMAQAQQNAPCAGSLIQPVQVEEILMNQKMPGQNCNTFGIGNVCRVTRPSTGVCLRLAPGAGWTHSRRGWRTWLLECPSETRRRLRSLLPPVV